MSLVGADKHGVLPCGCVIMAMPHDLDRPMRDGVRYCALHAAAPALAAALRDALRLLIHVRIADRDLEQEMGRLEGGIQELLARVSDAEMLF